MGTYWTSKVLTLFILFDFTDCFSHLLWLVKFFIFFYKFAFFNVTDHDLIVHFLFQFFQQSFSFSFLSSSWRDSSFYNFSIIIQVSSASLFTLILFSSIVFLVFFSVSSIIKVWKNFRSFWNILSVVRNMHYLKSILLVGGTSIYNPCFLFTNN